MSQVVIQLACGGRFHQGRRPLMETLGSLPAAAQTGNEARSGLLQRYKRPPVMETGPPLRSSSSGRGLGSQALMGHSPRSPSPRGQEDVGVNDERVNPPSAGGAGWAEG